MAMSVPALAALFADRLELPQFEQASALRLGSSGPPRSYPQLYSYAEVIARKYEGRRVWVSSRQFIVNGKPSKTTAAHVHRVLSALRRSHHAYTILISEEPPSAEGAFDKEMRERTEAAAESKAKRVRSTRAKDLEPLARPTKLQTKLIERREAARVRKTVHKALHGGLRLVTLCPRCNVGTVNPARGMCDACAGP